MKYVIIIGDGMADDPIPERGGQTPLEIADIPHMDRLCRKGTGALVRTVPHGVTPGSDTAILSILGYDPRRYYTGRSPLEAAGTGVTLQAGDVSYRCNMVSLESGQMPYTERKILSHSGGAIDGDSALALLQALEKDGRFAALAKENGMTFIGTPSFRHIAIQRDLVTEGLLTAPPHDHLGERLGDYLPSGCPAAAGLCALMERAFEILEYHDINRYRQEKGKLPANGIWFWAEGTAAVLPSLEEKYGIKGLTVSAVPLVQGIGLLAGLDSVHVPGATGELDTDYEGKAGAVLRGLQSGYDLAVLHIEAPDECTHNGDTEGKLEAIRRLDSRCIAHVYAGLESTGQDYRLLILSDHKTLSSTRGHDGAPVPYILYDNRKNTGWNRPYTERDCAGGGLLEEGYLLIERLFAE